MMANGLLEVFCMLVNVGIISTMTISDDLMVSPVPPAPFISGIDLFQI